MKIAMDVDGVCADFIGYICHQVGADWRQQTTWGFEESFGLDLSKQMYGLMQESATWSGLHARRGARQAIQRLHESGIEFHFVTAVPLQFTEIRGKWLESKLGVDTNQHMLLPISSTNIKAEFCQTMGFDTVVDDCPKIVNATAAAGLHSVLVPSRYMNEFTLDPRVKIQTLGQFVEEVTR